MAPPRRLPDERGPIMMLRQDFNRRHSPNRRRTRVEAFIQAEGARLAAEILDVSYDGMKLSVPHVLAPGTPITIEALGARIPAIVHWSRRSLAGVRLLERLERDILVALETADDDLADFR